jgi:hypothetical protein
LPFDGGNVVVEGVVVEQIPLVGAPAGVSHHACRSPGEGDRPMAGVLEPSEHDQPDEVPDVQAVGRRVAPVVDRHLTGADRLTQGLAVGRVVDEVACLEFGDEIGASHTEGKGTVDA